MRFPLRRRSEGADVEDNRDGLVHSVQLNVRCAGLLNRGLDVQRAPLLKPTARTRTPVTLHLSGAGADDPASLQRKGQKNLSLASTPELSLLSLTQTIDTPFIHENQTH